jgi:hypothetical protein
MVAKENGWSMYIDHTEEPRGYVLRFQFVMQDYEPSVTLEWGSTLTDFSPRITNVGQVAGVAARVWVAAIKTEFVVVLSWDYDRAAFDLQVFPGFGSIDDILKTGKRQGVLTLGAVGMAAAPRKILSELLPRLNNRLTGSGNTVGDPAIKSGRVVQIDGLGGQFGGLYRITSTTHTIDGSGYRTRFDARKDVWFGTVIRPKGLGGLLRVQGQTVG